MGIIKKLIFHGKLIWVPYGPYTHTLTDLSLVALQEQLYASSQI